MELSFHSHSEPAHNPRFGAPNGVPKFKLSNLSLFRDDLDHNNKIPDSLFDYNPIVQRETPFMQEDILH